MNTIRAYLVNFFYDVANLCCIIADRLSPTTDDIWRERRWRQRDAFSDTDYIKIPIKLTDPKKP